MEGELQGEQTQPVGDRKPSVLAEDSIGEAEAEAGKGLAASWKRGPVRLKRDACLRRAHKKRPKAGRGEEP